MPQADNLLGHEKTSYPKPLEDHQKVVRKLVKRALRTIQEIDKTTNLGENVTIRTIMTKATENMIGFINQPDYSPALIFDDVCRLLDFFPMTQAQPVYSPPKPTINTPMVSAKVQKPVSVQKSHSSTQPPKTQEVSAIFKKDEHIPSQVFEELHKLGQIVRAVYERINQPVEQSVELARKQVTITRRIIKGAMKTLKDIICEDEINTYLDPGYAKQLENLGDGFIDFLEAQNYQKGTELSQKLLDVLKLMNIEPERPVENTQPAETKLIPITREETPQVAEAKQPEIQEVPVSASKSVQAVLIDSVIPPNASLNQLIAAQTIEPKQTKKSASRLRIENYRETEDLNPVADATPQVIKSSEPASNLQVENNTVEPIMEATESKSKSSTLVSASSQTAVLVDTVATSASNLQVENIEVEQVSEAKPKSSLVSASSQTTVAEEPAQLPTTDLTSNTQESVETTEVEIAPREALSKSVTTQTTKRPPSSCPPKPKPRRASSRRSVKSVSSSNLHPTPSATEAVPPEVAESSASQVLPAEAEKASEKAVTQACSSTSIESVSLANDLKNDVVAVRSSLSSLQTSLQQSLKSDIDILADQIKSTFDTEIKRLENKFEQDQGAVMKTISQVQLLEPRLKTVADNIEQLSNQVQEKLMETVLKLDEKTDTLAKSVTDALEKSVKKSAATSAKEREATVNLLKLLTEQQKSQKNDNNSGQEAEPQVKTPKKSASKTTAKKSMANSRSKTKISGGPSCSSSSIKAASVLTPSKLGPIQATTDLSARGSTSKQATKTSSNKRRSVSPAKQVSKRTKTCTAAAKAKKTVVPKVSKDRVQKPNKKNNSRSNVSAKATRKNKVASPLPVRQTRSRTAAQ